MDKQAVKFWPTLTGRLSVETTEQPLPSEKFQSADVQGVVFDPVSPTHDEAISRLRAAVASLNPRQVVDGFLASLSTHRVAWRSALGSYSVARHLPVHESNFGESQLQCRTCGLYDYVHFAEHDLNILNFERLKWGGVRHADPIYGTLDLELFRASPPTSPTTEDISIFRELVAALAGAPAVVTSAKLHK